MSSFKVSVSSRYKELWRYNIIVVSELCDQDGSRIDFKSQESIVAPVGENIAAPPADYTPNRTIVLESSGGSYINLLIYIIPNTLPTTNEIAKTKPFPLTVKVEQGGQAIMNQVFEINQWSGDNISLEKLGLES